MIPRTIIPAKVDDIEFMIKETEKRFQAVIVKLGEAIKNHDFEDMVSYIEEMKRLEAIDKELEIIEGRIYGSVI